MPANVRQYFVRACNRLHLTEQHPVGHMGTQWARVLVRNTAILRGIPYGFMAILNAKVFQGSAALYRRCGGKYCVCFVAKFLLFEKSE